ncbi:18484_t:CDS:2, partial [Racocetra fulgida]
QEETKRSYLDLIYSNLSDENSTNNSSSSISNDDNIFHVKRKYFKKNKKITNIVNSIENLPLIDSNSLLLRICAAIYLSLNELWDISSDLALAPNQLDHAKKLLEQSYTEMKIAFELLNLNNHLALKLIELDEVIYYLALDSIGLDEDPIKWWQSNK